MTNSEYIARVITHYARNKTKIGTVSFDKTVGRFVIKNLDGTSPDVYTREIHCGHIYILKDIDGVWKIGQCELLDNGWAFCGTAITAKNCKDIQIVYPTENRLLRVTDAYIEQDANFGKFSEDFIRATLVNR